MEADSIGSSWPGQGLHSLSELVGEECCSTIRSLGSCSWPCASPQISVGQGRVSFGGLSLSPVHLESC